MRSSFTIRPMAAREKTIASEAAAVLVPAESKRKSIPVWLVRGGDWAREATLTEAQRAWAEAQGFKGGGRKPLLLPAADGALAGVLLGLGETREGDPMERAELAAGLLPGALPEGLYHLANGVEDAELAAVAWGLGGYRFRRYKTGNGKTVDGEGVPQLKLPRGADAARVEAIVDGVWLGGAIINTPTRGRGQGVREWAG